MQWARDLILQLWSSKGLLLKHNPGAQLDMSLYADLRGHKWSQSIYLSERWLWLFLTCYVAHRENAVVPNLSLWQLQTAAQSASQITSTSRPHNSAQEAAWSSLEPTHIQYSLLQICPVRHANEITIVHIDTPQAPLDGMEIFVTWSSFIWRAIDHLWWFYHIERTISFHNVFIACIQSHPSTSEVDSACKAQNHVLGLGSSANVLKRWAKRPDCHLFVLKVPRFSAIFVEFPLGS